MLVRARLLVDLAQLAELLLASSVPDLEEDGAVVGVERDVRHVDSAGRWVSRAYARRFYRILRCGGA